MEDKTKAKDLVRSETEVKKTKIVKDAKDPAVVFFPTNADSECMDGNTGRFFPLTINTIFKHYPFILMDHFIKPALITRIFEL